MSLSDKPAGFVRTLATRMMPRDGRVNTTIPKELKDEAIQLKINLATVLTSALLEEIRKVKGVEADALVSFVEEQDAKSEAANAK